MSKGSPLQSPFLFAWQAVGRARLAPREILARSGRRVKRASPVRRDLPAHQDRRALRARKVLLGRLEHFPPKAQHILRVRDSWRIRLA